MGSVNLTFLLPIRHPASVPGWDIVKCLMARTFASISNQTVPNWQAIVIANSGTDLPQLPNRFRVVWVNFDLLSLGKKEEDERTYYDRFRLEKGRRVMAGLVDARPTGHVMIVDYDDFVSRRVSEIVEDQPTSAGWFLGSGYIYDGGGLVYHYPRNFHEICGTSHIVRTDLLRIPAALSDAPTDYVKRMLGSHMSIKGELAKMGTPLAALPFHGAMYRVGHSASTEGTANIWSQFVKPRSLMDAPRAIARLSRLRLMSAKLRDEFGVKS